MSSKVVVNIVLVALCLAAGLWLGPKLHSAYDRFFPEPEYVIGDYAHLYERTGKQVVMFSTSTCPHCSDAREFLLRERIDYQDMVVDQSPDAKRQFEELGGGGVPQLFIGDRRITGYRESVIRDSLASVRK